MQEPEYRYDCQHCEEPIWVHVPQPGDVRCRNCGKVNVKLRVQDWTRDRAGEGADFDPKNDDNLSVKEVWVGNSSGFFSPQMRYDKDEALPSDYRRRGEAELLLTKTKYKKKSSPLAQVCDYKGGRYNANSVMGGSAHEKSKRGVEGANHQGEEWLHLWGDNLGGPSVQENFVAGSYAANTEMLVIERALSDNIALTNGLALKITAYCDEHDVGVYLKYKVLAPKGGKPDFVHYVDLTNRYFTATHADEVKLKIEGWLKAHNLEKSSFDPKKRNINHTDRKDNTKRKK